MGSVELTVADLDRMQQFYERAVGLRTLERDGDRVSLGVADGEPLVELIGDPDAPPAPRRASGLFHLALLVPDRASLAQSIHRVIDSGWNFTGASDHFVSEAMYLDDPEGNGIELYRDRPREEWTYDEGELRMGTVPLDIDDLMRQLQSGGQGDGMPAGTTMGHVHLKVAEIPGSGAFYEGRLGFDVTVRTYPSALFLSAGGYHHHLGMNIWSSAGAPAPPAGTRGLRRYRVLLPDSAELERLASELDGAERDDEGVTVTDPSGNVALLTTA
jgi:catechol 2,3-dioxygenase